MEEARPGWVSWLLRNRAWLDRWLLRGGVAVAAVTAGMALTARDAEARVFYAVYMAPLFLAGPLWLRLRLRRLETLPAAVVVLDIAIFALGGVRAVVGEPFPFSGHMLFLTYAAVVTPEPWFRLASLGMLLGTTAFKLLDWGHVRSWIWGLALGLAFAALHVVVMARRQSPAA